MDFERLAGQLRVLSYTNRLELLAILQQPRILSEIQLTPSASQAGQNPDRPISRQAVQNHLDKLVDIDLVRVRTADRPDPRVQKEYAVDPSRLFAIAEDFRKLSTLRTATDPALKKTDVLPDKDPDPGWPAGPKLVLVHGVREGQVHPLRRADLTGDRGWIIGRSSEADVTLDYDPYVSKQNSEIVPDGDRYRLLDLRTSRNGTFLNWEQLPVGSDVALEAGDVIGVGRSLMVFRGG